MEIVTQRVSSHLVRELAAKVGFHLAGVVAVPNAARSAPDFARYMSWVDRGLAGEMAYLTDHRAQVRAQFENLLPGVKSVISVGLSYADSQRTAGIARYAQGPDYHVVIRRGLEALAAGLQEHAAFEWRACVDTAPLLERSVARDAGLGWIGKNTCLINQESGSFCLLGELLTTLEITPDPGLDAPPPDRCGTCTRCLDACPTQALVPSPDGGFELDARRCISYFTIELRGPAPAEHLEAIGDNVFGCDICQDVCPWNRDVPASVDPDAATTLEELASLSEAEFRARFRQTAVSRAKHSAFLRNVAVAMGNSGDAKFRPALESLAASPDPLVADHGKWGLEQLCR